MVHVQKLTAEAMLAAPRRGVAVPNHSGKLALYTLSTHTFGNGTLKEVRVMDLDKGASAQLSADDKVHDALWIPGTNDVVFLRSGGKGRTQVLVASGEDVATEPYLAAEFNAPVANLKLKKLGDGGVAFMVTGLVGDDGLLFNEETVEKKSTVRVFDSAHVRVWNEMYKAQRYCLWYNKLELHGGKWKLAGQLHNLVNDATLDVPFGMYDLNSPDLNFDISHRGAVFLARDLTKRKPDESIVSLPCFVPLDCFTLPPASGPKHVSLPPGLGSPIGSNIRFSPDASNVAFLYTQQGDSYATRLCMASTSSLDAFDVFSLVTRSRDDDEHDPPGAFEFAGSSDTVILQSQKCGRTALATLKLQDGAKPRVFFQEGSTAGFHPLEEGRWDRLLVSSSSFIDSSLWQVVGVAEAAVLRTVSSATMHGAKFGLSAKMVTEFWYEGAEDVCIHSFMLRPSDFDESKTYPWVLMPHGGPVWAWSDAWSTRWNLASWAEQGYVVVCPNITGSTGYGLALVRGIKGQWGGRPYQDLVNLVAHLEKLPYLDQGKAVLAGASYGGYMVSWMLGHDVIKKFCCAVWHDGIYNLPTCFLQSDVIFDDGDFGAVYPWQDPAAFEKHNPGRPELLREWRHAPPTIIVHSEKDYRCPMTEGVAAMNILQAHGVPTRLVTFSDEGHWVLGPENSRAWHDMVWGWVKRCVDGEIKR
ncbi:Dipeptidyl-peptidase 5, partial [Tolypocladium capitatum]